MIDCSIKIHFKDSKGNDLKTIEANEGDDILSIAHEHDIDLEGVFLLLPHYLCFTNSRSVYVKPGACEGSVACSTCHVILPPEYYDLLPEPEVHISALHRMSLT